MARRIRARESHVPEALVASTVITDPSQIIRRNRADMVPDRQAWRWFDRIGEVHFGLTSGAREVSRATLMPVRWEDPSEFVPVTSGPAVDYVMALASKEGGTPGLIQKFYLNRKVTGDGYLFGYPDGQEDWFDFLSTDELVSNGSGTTDQPGGRKVIQVKRERSPVNADSNLTSYNLADCTLSRVWTPHPRYNDEADAPLKALDLICEELDLLTMSLKAKLSSRLATAGILYLSTDLNSTAIPKPPDGNPVRFSEDNLLDYLMRIMSTRIQHPDEAAAAIPIMLRGPQGEVNNIIRWITMDREIFAADIQQRDELIARILHGLDLRPEQVEGFGQSNHWSAWSTQDVHLKVDVGPDLEALCWAATKDYLWPQLRMAVKEGDIDLTEAEIRRHWVWYDLSNLTVRPNKADSYLKLEAVGAVNKEALRDATGAQENEAPNDEEWVRHVGEVLKVPYLMLWGTKYNTDTEIDWEKVTVPAPDPGPAPDPNSSDGPAGPGTPAADRGRPGNGDSNAPRSERPDA